jgi:thiamine biosynthesis protein ThiS
MPENPGIQVSVNGEAVRLPSGSTLADLLRRLDLDRGRVAVEHNLRVVPRAEHPTLRLNHGDRLEIVTFVGGGSLAQGSGDAAPVLTSPGWPPIR